MSDVDKLLARAQVGMAFMFAVGFISVLLVLVFWAKDLPPIVNTLLTGLLGVFGTIVTLQQNFLFARQRGGGIPDPATATVTQTQTAPDGTITTVRSPAHLPPPPLPSANPTPAAPQPASGV
jgi:hypothetical protein